MSLVMPIVNLGVISPMTCGLSEMPPVPARKLAKAPGTVSLAHKAVGDSPSRIQKAPVCRELRWNAGTGSLVTLLLDLAKITRVFHELVAVCNGIRLTVTSAPRV